jgi:hypothetical protein
MSAPGGVQRCGWALFVAGALSLGCSESPDEVYARCKSAIEDEDLETYVGCFTERSRTILRSLLDLEERRSRLGYLANVYDLLPGDEVDEVVVEGALAVVRARSARAEYPVSMVKEKGRWRIDALSLPTFWSPLR